MDRQEYLKCQTDLLIAADMIKSLPLSDMMDHLGWVKIEENGKILDSYGREMVTDPDTIRRTLILAAEFKMALYGHMLKRGPASETAALAKKATA